VRVPHICLILADVGSCEHSIDIEGPGEFTETEHLVILSEPAEFVAGVFARDNKFRRRAEGPVFLRSTSDDGGYLS
jgi:hypothetical protein